MEGLTRLEDEYECIYVLRDMFGRHECDCLCLRMCGMPLEDCLEVLGRV